MGYIFIFTNPCLSKGLYLGYANNWQNKLNTINSKSILAADFQPYLIYETTFAFSKVPNPENTLKNLFNTAILYDNIFWIRRKDAEDFIKSIAKINNEIDKISYPSKKNNDSLDKAQKEEPRKTETGVNEQGAKEKLYTPIQNDKNNRNFGTEQRGRKTIETTQFENIVEDGDEEEKRFLKENNETEVNYDSLNFDEFCRTISLGNATDFEEVECKFLGYSNVVSSIYDITEFVLHSLYYEYGDIFVNAVAKPALGMYIRLSKPIINTFKEIGESGIYFYTKLTKRDMVYLFNKLSDFLRCDILNEGLLFTIDDKNDDEYIEEEQGVESNFNNQLTEEHININETINFDGTVVQAIIYEGQTYKTETYVDLIDWVVDLFPKISNDEINTYISTEHHTYGDSNYIVKNPNELSKPHRLGTYPFYVDEEITPSQAIRFIRYYTKKSGINLNDFEIVVGR